MIASWVVNVVWIGVAIYSTQYGVGVLHMWDLSLSDLFVMLKVLLFSRVSKVDEVSNRYTSS